MLIVPIFRPRVASSSFTLLIRTMAKGGGGGGKKGQVTKKKIFDVETDTNKLLSHCCGLNYRTEGDWSEPVELKPDTEYPDWLWKMNIKRPRPTSDELEYGTLEYFKTLEKEADIRFRSQMKFEKRYRPKLT